VPLLWRMHHILQVMLRLPIECNIFCVLLFNECVLCVTMTWLLINHELRYMTVFTSTAIWQTDGAMKCTSSSDPGDPFLLL
jgi:hypothetical protein